MYARTRRSDGGDRALAPRGAQHGDQAGTGAAAGGSAATRDLTAPAPRVPCRRYDRRRRRLQRRFPLRAARADARRASACASATSSARGRRSPPAGSSACRGAASSHERRPAVKIAVIGGAGVRTPLLVDGLTRLRPADRRDRALRRRSASAWRSSAASRRGCPRGARVTLVPVGGPMRHAAPASCSRASASAASSGACATRRPRSATASSARRRSGPAGFAMAARTIPHMVRYAREIDRARARRLDRQLHQPGRHGHRGDAHGTAPGDRHLRHADRAVRRGGARARPADPTAATSTTSA